MNGRNKLNFLLNGVIPHDSVYELRKLNVNVARHTWKDLSVEVTDIPCRAHECFLYWTHPCILSVTKRPLGWLFAFHFILVKMIVYFPKGKFSWTSFIVGVGCSLFHSVTYAATVAVLHDFLLSYNEGEHICYYCLCIKIFRIMSPVLQY